MAYESFGIKKHNQLYVYHKNNTYKMGKKKNLIILDLKISRHLKFVVSTLKK